MNFEWFIRYISSKGRVTQYCHFNVCVCVCVCVSGGGGGGGAGGGGGSSFEAPWLKIMMCDFRWFCCRRSHVYYVGQYISLDGYAVYKECITKCTVLQMNENESYA